MAIQQAEKKSKIQQKTESKKQKNKIEWIDTNRDINRWEREENWWKRIQKKSEIVIQLEIEIIKKNCEQTAKINVEKISAHALTKEFFD